MHVCVCVADQLCRQPVVKGKPVIDRFGSSVDRQACAPSDDGSCEFANQTRGDVPRMESGFQDFRKPYENIMK